MTIWRFLRALLGLAVVLLVAFSGSASASDGPPTRNLVFFGQAIIPTGFTFEGTPVGGLSGIACPFL